MVFLLEVKERFKVLYNKYDMYIVPIARFITALVAMLLINSSVGYMSKVNNILVVLLIAAVCALLPNGFSVVILGVALLLNLYALSAELALVSAIIFVVMYLLYFRFTPKSSFLLILTSICCMLKIPYVIPVAAGFVAGAVSVVPTCFGVIVYYIIQTGAKYETAIVSQKATTQAFSFIVDSMLANKTMIIMLVAFVVATIVVYVIKRMSVDYSWLYAIISGEVVMFIIMIVGKLVLGADVDILFLVLGVILSTVIAYILKVVFFNLDYRRTEIVQYEDDEYYYYVKAVPKITIAGSDVKVKKINARKSTSTDDIKKGKTYRPVKRSSEEPDEFDINIDTDEE